MPSLISSIKYLRRLGYSLFLVPPIYSAFVVFYAFDDHIFITMLATPLNVIIAYSVGFHLVEWSFLVFICLATARSSPRIQLSGEEDRLSLRDNEESRTRTKTIDRELQMARSTFINNCP